MPTLTSSMLVGASTAVITTGAFGAVFNENALIIAIFGALGGSARWLFLREKFREGLRLAVLGALLAFGLGNLASFLVKSWLGQVPDHILAQPETVYYLAFVVGLGSVTILGRFIDAKEEDTDE